MKESNLSGLDVLRKKKNKKKKRRCPLLSLLRSVQFLDFGHDCRNQLLFNACIPNDLNSNRRIELRRKHRHFLHKWTAKCSLLDDRILLQISDKTAPESDFSFPPKLSELCKSTFSTKMSFVQILPLPSVERCFSSPSCS